MEKPLKSVFFVFELQIRLIVFHQLFCHIVVFYHMSYKQVRVYLFSKSYAHSIFQECIHSAKRKEKHRVKARIGRILLLGQIQQKIPRPITKENEKLSTYIQIEKELKRLVKKRKERGVFDLEEYEYALLDPAIERVAGASLAGIVDDRTFDMELIARKALYQRWYYQTAAKYRLPTLRIIPFLLRLLHC